MNNSCRRAFLRGAMALGLAAAAIGGLGAAAASLEEQTPPTKAERAQSAKQIVNGWPDPSRLVALGMIERNGPPQRQTADTLTWFDIYHGRKTIVYRAEPGEPMIEQSVLYRIPEDKVADVKRFDDRIKINPETAEMSVRTDNQRTNFLILNLAHEVASGFRTVSDAREFYEKQMKLEAAGKSSRYRDRLLFDEPFH